MDTNSIGQELEILKAKIECLESELDRLFERIGEIEHKLSMDEMTLEELAFDVDGM